MKPYQHYRMAVNHRSSGHQLSTRRQPVDPLLTAVINSSPEPNKPDKLTPEMIVDYAEKWLDIYLSRSRMYYDGSLEGTGISVRIDEVRSYIEIWRLVKAAEGDWELLTKLAKSEVLDAYYDEHGYD